MASCAVWGEQAGHLVLRMILAPLESVGMASVGMLSELELKTNNQWPQKEPHSPVLPSCLVSHSNQQSGSPTDWTEPRSTFICKNCSQMFYTEKGLSSHMCFHSDQWPSPLNQEQQVK